MENKFEGGSQRKNIDPDRLLNAADVLLKAAERNPQGVAIVDVWAASESLCGGNAFNAEELVEAMFFLCRLGLTECVTSTNGPVKKVP
jgi:hypothetical protein